MRGKAVLHILMTYFMRSKATYTPLDPDNSSGLTVTDPQVSGRAFSVIGEWPPPTFSF